MMYLLMYIDDISLTSKHIEDIIQFKGMLKLELNMKDLGSTKRIMSMELRKDGVRGIMYVSQTSYIEKVLKRFGMNKSKSVSTPFVAHFKYGASQSPKSKIEKHEMRNVPYLNVVSCLMYAMIGTRPDLAYTLSMMSRYMVNLWK